MTPGKSPIAKRMLSGAITDCSIGFGRATQSKDQQYDGRSPEMSVTATDEGEDTEPDRRLHPFSEQNFAQG
jgi:phage head maturation protease